MRDCSDWRLDPQTFAKINRHYGPLEVDLFASRLTNQCQRYYSWRPDPFADAFMQDWSAVKGFANPPWNLVPRVLNQVQTQEADIVLVTPLWKAQPWYALLLSMLVDWPCPLPQQELLTPMGEVSLSPPRLVAWSISGNPSKVKAFLSRLQTSLPRLRQTTHSLSDGIAGVGSHPFSGPVSEVANFVFLLAITRPSRSADLSQLSINRMKSLSNGVAFTPAVLAKQSRQGKPIEEFFFPSFPDNSSLCPVGTISITRDR